MPSHAPPLPPLSLALAKLGIHRRCDAVLHLPLRYEDETRLTPVAALIKDESAQVEVVVIDSKVQFRPRRQLTCEVRDANSDDRLLLRFFHFYPNLQKSLAPGSVLRAFGKMRLGTQGPEIVHPRLKKIKPHTPLPTTLTPIYSMTSGINQARIQRLINEALSTCPLDDALPPGEREALNLLPFKQAVTELHHPKLSHDDLEAAWVRIRFDELLAQQISLRSFYLKHRQYKARPLDKKLAVIQTFLHALPFRLTATQTKIWEELQQDLNRPYAMRRLLQGDVGSGKTVLAFLALLLAYGHGHQGVLMAPTEILMEQHYAKLCEWCAILDIPIYRLGSGVGSKERQKLAQIAEAGTPCLAVGTHALVEKKLHFTNLALAVVDEQHRFGVEQRLHLGQGSSDYHPHLLMLSATPIPRTLAMSYCADVDLSILDELPPGRRPVLTKLISQERREEVLARLRTICALGRQAYWVCPMIEESLTSDLTVAIATFSALKDKLAPISVDLLHGQMPSRNKKDIMTRFVAGTTQILVTTTVIEVGVDVPNATVMVIENAERFGLAQLHQLRGRVGRGSQESTCLLLYGKNLTPTAIERLKITLESNDGFVIAQRDLQLRGPGEVLGTRQSGLPLLRYADLERDAKWVPVVRTMAEKLLREHPDLAQIHLQRWRLDAPTGIA